MKIIILSASIICTILLILVFIRMWNKEKYSTLSTMGQDGEISKSLKNKYWVSQPQFRNLQSKFFDDKVANMYSGSFYDRHHRRHNYYGLRYPEGQE